jgi:hypothetical protein
MAAETYDEQQEREWHETATRIAEKQLRSAMEVARRVMGGDQAAPDPAVVAALVQAIAINLSTVRRKR